MQKSMQHKASSGAMVQKKGVKKADKGAAGRKQMMQKTSMSSKAGLILPVPRFAKLLRAGKFSRRVSPGASVFLTSVLEYLLAELLDMSAKAAERQQKHRIAPKHVLLGIQEDQEFLQLLGHVTIRAGGVPPNIHPDLYPKKNSKSKGEGGSMEDSDKDDESMEEGDAEEEEEVDEDETSPAASKNKKSSATSRAVMKSKQKKGAMKASTKGFSKGSVPSKGGKKAMASEPHMSTAAPSEDESDMEERAADGDMEDNYDDGDDMRGDGSKRHDMSDEDEGSTRGDHDVDMGGKDVEPHDEEDEDEEEEQQPVERIRKNQKEAVAPSMKEKGNATSSGGDTARSAVGKGSQNADTARQGKTYGGSTRGTRSQREKAS